MEIAIICDTAYEHYDMLDESDFMKNAVDFFEREIKNKYMDFSRLEE